MQASPALARQFQRRSGLVAHQKPSHWGRCEGWLIEAALALLDSPDGSAQRLCLDAGSLAAVSGTGGEAKPLVIGHSHAQAIVKGSVSD